MIKNEPGILQYKEIPYSDIGSIYNDSIRSLSDLGILNVNSRLVTYGEILSFLAISTDNIEQLRKEYKDEVIISALIDGMELIEIYQSIGHLFNNENKDRIKDIIGGSLSYYEESLSSSSNHSRNISFELYIASKLSKTGFIINLNSIADIEAKLGDYTIYIECKRIQRYQQLRKRIKDSYAQLKTRYPSNNSSKIFGMSFISLAPVFNNNINLFSVFNKPMKEIQDFVGKYLISICSDNYYSIKLAKSEKTIALWFHTRIPFVTNNGDIGIYGRFISNSSESSDIEGQLLFKNIRDRMNMGELDIQKCLRILSS